MPTKSLERVRRETANVLTEFAIGTSEEVPCEHADVLTAFAERWEVDRVDREAIEEVLAKLPLRRHGAEVAVRRGDDADVRAHRLVSADPLERLLLQHTEDFGLKRDIAARMLQFPETLEERPFLEFALRRLASGQLLDRIVFCALWPAGRCRLSRRARG